MRDDNGYDENGLLEGEAELWRNAQWRVTTVAIEDISGRNSCPYWIPIREIHSADWRQHMSQKNWVKVHLFDQALAKARELFPKEQAA